MNKKIKAWYFAPPDKKLRYGDNRKIVVGRTHKVKFPFTDANGLVWEKPSCCHAGLHASIHPLDALGYAASNFVYRVELSGVMDVASDKIAATERMYLWGYDAEFVLKKFARMCALDVARLWDAPAVVVQYLKTGDDSLRAAAGAAARAAARAAAWDTAWAAACDTAWAAAWAAAGAAAGDAAGDTAWDTACDTACDTAWAAAREKQNRRLYRMLMEGRAANV